MYVFLPHLSFFVLALLVRLPFVFRLPGHDASLGILQAGKACVELGRYATGRPPGSPVYDCTIGFLNLFFQGSSLPYYYFTNLFSVLCTGVTLCFLFLIFKKYISTKKAFFAVVLYNFYPHELVLGGATTDMVFLLLFCTLSFYAFLNGKFLFSLFLACLAIGSRVQALAFALPLAGAIAYFLIFKFQLPKSIVILFILSSLLPSLIQIQVRPWRWPPFVVRDGIIKAHLKHAWAIRGGG